MKPIELAKLAVEAMISPGTLGVILAIPRGGMPKGFPRGKLLNEIMRNGRVEKLYSFDPEKVLACLVKNGLIAIERTDEKKIIVKPIEVSNEDEA